MRCDFELYKQNWIGNWFKLINCEHRTCVIAAGPVFISFLFLLHLHRRSTESVKFPVFHILWQWVHPSISFCSSGVAELFSSSCYQAWWDIKSLLRVLGPPRGLLPVGLCPGNFQWRATWRILIRRPNPLKGPPSIRQSGSSALNPSPCIQGWARPHDGGNSFQKLVSTILFFRSLAALMTTREGQSAGRLVWLSSVLSSKAQVNEYPDNYRETSVCVCVSHSLIYVSPLSHKAPMSPSQLLWHDASSPWTHTLGPTHSCP